ncbi:nucleoside-diphosphate-sugar epimerase [Friedmanniella endophytica]|uniref:Nucleoside-diphosphate-sugar epimerase n=1 Tax=Microlunatus kandeliicorticis TaxID=1759536 RepID=A0A7W3P5H8_9ACTN|nr:SDR family oxidoreductase [Microlunatus kandeliicorticis]MBA8793875.1 nucleoside-diphosphate-sugar epimerase [Microlunatus kandeliicorticis]
MRIFVTGASGWIGSATVDELLAAGHHVVGLARSDASAASLTAKGVKVRRGDLDDLESIRAGATDADAVLHLANKHDFVHPEVSNRAERNAVRTIVDTLEGSDRRFLMASGVAGLAQGRPATEDDPSPFVGPDAPRGGSENLALDSVDRGVHAVAVRFAPTTHGTGDHGFVAALTAAARQHGRFGWAGDGSNRWAAVHVTDAAKLIVAALDRAPAGARLHAIAEEGIPVREIAEAIGAGVGVPVGPLGPDELDVLGPIGFFFAMDMAASSARTRALLDWTPTGPTLLEDLAAGEYFATA